MSFHFKQFSITHQSAGLKVNTDGCLLGAISNHVNAAKCLDIGTGTGVIALMMAQKYPSAKITAIELNETACNQAKLNIEASPFKSQIELLHFDLLNYTSSIKFDLIVCNPPYFTKHLKGADTNKNMALHNDTMPQNLMLKKVVDLLNDVGLFWVIYPPHEMKLLEEESLKNNLHIATKIIIENKAGQHYRSIAAFCKLKKTPIEEMIVLTDMEGNRSSQFSKIMSDYYL